MAEYAPLAQLKSWLRIEDTYDDVQLALCLTAASRAIDLWTNRKFDLDSEPTTKRFSPNHYSILFVPDIGTTDGLEVAYDLDADGVYETALSPSDYQLEPGTAPYSMIRLFKANLPVAPDHRFTVQVTARWGFPSVPETITQACLILAARYYKRSDSPEGVAGFGEFGTVRITRVDADVEALIASYKREGWS